MKNKMGPLIAVLVFILVLLIGFILGKYWAEQYNAKHNTNYTIFNILKIIDESTETILDGKMSTIDELCGTDTGICNKVVGSITLENNQYNLSIYYDFDNITDKSAYFKINDNKVGNFINLDEFYILDGKYLVVTETTTNSDAYIIHVYNATGYELNTFNATYNDGELFVDDSLNYYYCNTNDVNSEGLPALTYYQISVNSSNVTSSEISKNYQSCQ